ncbi:hypothetical protein OG601_45330 [Streptomyces sp. NBC_01239]|uniref:hypothetical protein n=1 Tax=Streptomyces sp. NBC_01239 TaxID=2903792 RepID=UPI00224CA151|nr:hypothetical protein [Streptomyces sp. NBC_01239]MCX4817824.1 hypothetical protein [Streptomyces sp. NBC_01239]
MPTERAGKNEVPQPDRIAVLLVLLDEDGLGLPDPGPDAPAEGRSKRGCMAQDAFRERTR